MLYAFKITEMIHELKTWNEYFEEVFMGHKTFEVRKNDRDFKKGDTLILKEWDNVRETFTGRKLARNVTYVFEGGSFGLEKGFVVMAIQ
jgi:ASC-1-like (ASCH) protein